MRYSRCIPLSDRYGTCHSANVLGCLHSLCFGTLLIGGGFNSPAVRPVTFSGVGVAAHYLELDDSVSVEESWQAILTPFNGGGLNANQLWQPIWPASDVKVRALGPELKPVASGTGGAIYVDGSDLAPVNRPDPQLQNQPRVAGGIAMMTMILFVMVMVPFLARVH
jgi:hypothetical protein